MNIAMLSAASAVHTIRWANGLCRIGHEIILFSAHRLRGQLDERVRIEILPFTASLGYFLNSKILRDGLRRIKPDILNVHFASGYGTLVRLTGFHPYLLSVWGSDVYDFPLRSRIHRAILKKNLQSADAVASTSNCMLTVTKGIFDHPKTFVTPFGIDEGKFAPKSKGQREEIVIGTVKTLSSKYGIDTLLDTFSILVRRCTTHHLVLEITGDGPDRQRLERYTNAMDLGQSVRFFGHVDHDQVPSQLHRLDIYVALSRLDSESFGVAILEASACGLPVVVSDVDGLAEVTINGTTGLVVPRESPEAAADAIESLILDRDLRERMGTAGRAHVLANYTWSASLEKMVDAYRQTIDMAGF